MVVRREDWEVILFKGIEFQFCKVKRVKRWMVVNGHTTL